MIPDALMVTASKLVTYCRDNNTEQGLRELYHPEAVSVEAAATPGAPGPETRGVDGIREKHRWWNTTFDVHSASVDGPYCHGDDRFAVIFEFDATNHETGDRSQTKEVGVYYVDADFRIVREEFFYRS